MPAVVMSGAPVADNVLASVGVGVERLAAAGKTVGLGTVLVGDDPASVHYVARKHEVCQQFGIGSFDVRIPGTARQEDLLQAVDQLNEDRAVDGFLIQNPVPAGFDYAEALTRVDPAKDVDGLHPVNLGYLTLGERGHPRPCTPLGIQAMLEYYGVPLEGRSVVVVGRGPTLGRPLRLAALVEGAWCQCRRDSSSHGGKGLGRLHSPGRHCGRGGRRAQHNHSGRDRPGLVRCGGRPDLGGQAGHL